MIVDRALEARAADDRPIRIALIGAGFMARAIARQVARRVPGIRLTAVVNRHLEGAVDVWREAGQEDTATATNRSEFDRHIAAGRAVVAEDPDLACDSEAIDVIVESTGAVEFGAGVVMRAIDHGRQ